ncbi:hypothetical protein Vadar_002955 [Vaccinium darrowii]|uniref:Uncharacterized protein n=1 Tax=Vaccinium darrowii TaxID=229202 RepID=A0ACB7X773_9ERIC|nr:hypothetical protein Vadar_002955 [Vaccinium darrowii]
MHLKYNNTPPDSNFSPVPSHPSLSKNTFVSSDPLDFSSSPSSLANHQNRSPSLPQESIAITATGIDRHHRHQRRRSLQPAFQEQIQNRHPRRSPSPPLEPIAIRLLFVAFFPRRSPELITITTTRIDRHHRHRNRSPSLPPSSSFTATDVSGSDPKLPPPPIAITTTGTNRKSLSLVCTSCPSTKALRTLAMSFLASYFSLF